MNDFGRNAQALDGLHYYCKLCTAEKQRRWVKLNPEKVRQMREDYLARIKEANAARDPYA